MYAGVYFEGIHRRTGNGNCQLYHREQCDGKADGESVWDIEINRTYGCSEIERFVWIID